MISLRRHTTVRRLSLALIGALVLTMLMPPGARLVPRAHAAGGAKTVLAFPVSDESEGATLGEAASRLTSALALAGRDVPQVDLEVFSPASPMTRRAIADGSLRNADIEGIIDAATALLIGQAFGVDAVVLVGAQSLTIKGDPRTAELAVMGTEYDVAANVDAETGAIVAAPKGTTFGVSGLAKGRTAKADEDATLLRSAARDAAYKIMHVLSGRSAEDYVERGAEPKKRSNMWRYLAALLVIGGIIAATSSGGDDNGPVPTDDTVPTRCTARPSAGGGGAEHDDTGAVQVPDPAFGGRRFLRPHRQRERGSRRHLVHRLQHRSRHGVRVPDPSSVYRRLHVAMGDVQPGGCALVAPEGLRGPCCRAVVASQTPRPNGSGLRTA